MTDKNTTQIIAKASNESNVPDKETIKTLKGISENFDIEMSRIKEMYKDLMVTKAIQNLDVESEVDRERHAVRILMAEITGMEDREDHKGVDFYCDFGIELGQITDQIARTSVNMSNSFGKEYDFSSVLGEINRVRSLLENRMNKKFFGGE